jgi:hypothetical protein
VREGGDSGKVVAVVSVEAEIAVGGRVDTVDVQDALDARLKILATLDVVEMELDSDGRRGYIEDEEKSLSGASREVIVSGAGVGESSFIGRTGSAAIISLSFLRLSLQLPWSGMPKYERTLIFSGLLKVPMLFVEIFIRSDQK